MFEDRFGHFVVSVSVSCSHASFQTFARTCAVLYLSFITDILICDWKGCYARMYSVASVLKRSSFIVNQYFGSSRSITVKRLVTSTFLSSQTFRQMYALKLFYVIPDVSTKRGDEIF